VKAARNRDRSVWRGREKGIARGDVILEAAGRRSIRAANSPPPRRCLQGGRRSVLLRVKSADGAKFIAVPVKAG
jgi:serine protease Do